MNHYIYYVHVVTFFAGCPAGLDPMEVTNQLAQKGVIIYLVGCEPSINPYKEFFTALAHVTGGQYVPLRQAKLLAKVGTAYITLLTLCLVVNFSTCLE